MDFLPDIIQLCLSTRNSLQHISYLPEAVPTNVFFAIHLFSANQKILDFTKKGITMDSKLLL